VALKNTLKTIVILFPSSTNSFLKNYFTSFDTVFAVLFLSFSLSSLLMVVL